MADERRTADEPNGRFKLTTEKALTIVVTVMLAWAMVQGRIAVLESRVDASDYRLQRIEQKIDQLLQRVP